MLAGISDLFIAPHLPLTHRRNNLQFGRERGYGSVDSDLVVAFTGATVGDRVAAMTTSGIDGELGDQRAPKSREQRIAEAVGAVGEDRRSDEVAREFVTRVNHFSGDCAKIKRLLFDDGVVLSWLTKVDRERHDLGLILVLNPFAHHARVEAAGEQQQYAPDFVRVG